jgi:carbonic anhydrase/acetyltransferase-like protein (isoleucine patch superfamily)
MHAAGALLTQGKVIPAGQLWAGRPAKYVRDLNEADLAGMRAGVAHYVELAKRHAGAVRAASA